MATRFYLRAVDDNETRWSDGKQHPALNGTSLPWRKRNLYTTAGALTSAFTRLAEDTVAGPTNGLELGGQSSLSTAPPLWLFVSTPIDASITISGTVTANLFAWESNSAANAAINVRLFKISGQNNTITEFGKSARTTELGTTVSQQNFTFTPTSTSFVKGDRIGVTVFADDASSNMGTGYQVFCNIDGASGTNGFSYIEFTENLTMWTQVTGTVMVFSNAVSDVVPASGSAYQMSTSRGSALTTAVTNTQTNPSTPIQITGSAGGSVIEWYTYQLADTTLVGAIYCALWGFESNSAANATLGVEIAVCDGNGSNAVVWGQNYLPDELATGSGGWGLYVQGPETNVVGGQRLRFRVLAINAAGTNTTTTAAQRMVSGYTVSFRYSDVDGGNDDSIVAFGTNTISQYVAPAGSFPFVGGGYYS